MDPVKTVGFVIAVRTADLFTFAVGNALFDKFFGGIGVIRHHDREEQPVDVIPLKDAPDLGLVCQFCCGTAVLVPGQELGGIVRINVAAAVFFSEDVIKQFTVEPFAKQCLLLCPLIFRQLCVGIEPDQGKNSSRSGQ